MDERVLTEDERALKLVTAALVDACGGGRVVASVLGVVPSLISYYGSQSYPDRFMPIDRVLQLERLCGQPIVSRWLKERAQSAISPAALAIADALAIAVTGGDVQTTILRALDDGHVSAAERAEIRKHLDAAIRTLHDIRQKVEQP